MNKADLIAAMAAESGLSKVDSKKALDAFLATTTKAMKKGERVLLSGLAHLL
jgi:DNA-binding protein HU-beta